MKILVTGATGFVGNYVVRELIRGQEHEIITTGLEPADGLERDWLESTEYVPADLRDRGKEYYDLFQRPDLMIHLAWAGLPNYNGLFHIEENLYDNYFFIKHMVERGLKKVVVIGTCLEYGMQNGALAEDMVTRPITTYGIAKDTLRKFIQQLNEEKDFEFVWIRLFYMIGEGQNEKSLMSQLARALSNNDQVFNMSGGEQLRDYLPVEKVAENIVKISLQSRINGIINCCSGEPISVRRLVEQYLRREKKTINLNLGYYPYPDYEPMAFWGDKAKLQKALIT